MTVLLVGNPTAQSGKNKARIDRALGLFRDAGVRSELLPTLPFGKTIGAVRDALDAGAFEKVVAMGGDGTFREVAAGLYTSARRSDVALGMLPTGTANDQGKSFGLEASPGALARNVEVICEGRETRLDVGELRTDPSADPDLFFDSAGWGLSARVLATRNRDREMIAKLGPLKELYRDHAVYAGAFLKTFVDSYVIDDKLRAVAVLDGVRVELSGLTDLIVKNTKIYAGAWVFDHDSKHDDGLFELVPFCGKRDWASKAIVDLQGNPISEQLLNEIGIAHSPHYRARHMSLELFAPAHGAPLAAQIDGEEWPASTKVDITVVARALRLVVPA